MFRKPFADFNVRGFVRLRASDRRKFQETVIEEFSVTSPEMAELLVPEVMFSAGFETHSHVSGVAYLTSESVPLWFTLGKDTSDYIPTVYTLWKCSDLLPILTIPGESVPRMLHAPFLLSSDIEITFQPSASVSIGQLVCITQGYQPRANGTPRVGSALAVGRMDLPSDLVEGGTKGKALTLLHAWKDQLWEMGGEEKPPRPRLLQGGMDEEDETEEDDTDEEGTCDESKAAAEMQPEIVKNGSVPKELSQEDVSNALRTALLESISVTLSKLPPGSFPIPPSIFYETYILPYRSFQLIKAAKTPVDIKHSGFKSLTAFLKVCVKEGLVKTKETKGGTVVTGINASHSDVQAHVRHVTVREVEEHKEKLEEAQAREMEKLQEERRERQVTFLRKPSPVTAAFFSCIGKDPEEPLTEEEIETVVEQYLRSKRLFKPHDLTLVNVSRDKLLLDIFSNGKGKKEELLEGQFMGTNKVVSRIIDNTTACYKISTCDKRPIIREGTPNPISVSAVRRKNHKVTYISGFEIFSLNTDTLAEGLRKACASSTTVQPDPRNPELKQIAVQGEHVGAVAEYLISKGVQKRWIEVRNNAGAEKVETVVRRQIVKK